MDGDLLPFAVFFLDDRGVVVEVNQPAADLVGVPADELVGASFDERVDPRGLDGLPLWTVIGVNTAGPEQVARLPEKQATVRRPDGTTVSVRAEGSLHRGGRVVVLRAATGIDENGPQGIEIVSTVSHELRSPLTSVKGYTSLLLSRWERLGDEQKKMMLGQVHHDADRVTRLVTELLDISRLETGRLVLRRQMVDLKPLAESVVEKVSLEYPDLECDIAIADDLPRVYADPDKVEQVLTNLVENAAKYGSPKGLRVTATVGDGSATVAVTDQGEGIPEADLPRVFQKFFRRDHGKPTGTGLGLWISRGLVEAHGGELTVESKPGGGATFSFTLPTTSLEEVLGQT